jgi:hypothetical protein
VTVNGGDACFSSAKCDPRFLYLVTFAWKPEQRILDHLWNGMCGALRNTTSGKVLGLYRVAAQQRAMAIIDVPDANALNRFSLMAELQSPAVETVWLLGDYIGFAEDVQKHYRFERA